MGSLDALASSVSSFWLMFGIVPVFTLHFNVIVYVPFQIVHKGLVNNERPFVYDGVFDGLSTQDEVYAKVGRPVLHDVMRGMHVLMKLVYVMMMTIMVMIIRPFGQLGLWARFSGVRYLFTSSTYVFT
jgi:hypothetical protein